MIIKNDQIIFNADNEEYYVPKYAPWDVEKYPQTTFKSFDFQKEKVVYLFILYLTDECNLSCDYCFEKKGHNKMTVVTPDLFIEFIKKYKENNMIIRFFGGEPLLNIDLLKCFVEKINMLKKIGYKISLNIFTNLYKVRLEDIDYFKHNDITIFASVDGPPQIHDLHRTTKDKEGSYDKVFENVLRVCQKMKRRLCIRTVYYLDNELSLLEVIDHFVKNNLYIVSIGFPYRISNMDRVFSQEMLDRLKDDLTKFENRYLDSVKQRKYEYVGIHPFSTYIKNMVNKNIFLTDESCGVCKSNIAISTEGGLYPCHAFTNMDEYKMGDIFNGLRTNKLREFRGENLKKCKNCPICYYCLLRCPAYMFDLNEEGEKNVYCKISEMLFITSIKIYYRLKTEVPDSLKIIKKFIGYGDNIYGNV